jgi:enterochelin esterase-like enzyme
VTAVQPPAVVRVGVPSTITPQHLEERRAHGEPFPIVDREACTFALHGEVIGVRLVHFGVGLTDDLGFEQLGESDWWLLSLAVPPGSRIEYKLEVVDSFGTQLIPDPLNPDQAANPFGVNSVCAAYGYAAPAWTQFDESVRAGQLVEWTRDSVALGRAARTWVYLPAGFTDHPETPYPAMIVLDGGDYLRYASAATVLDNLIHRGDLPPIVAAFSDPGERLIEYADDPRHHRHLIEELVPELEAQFPLAANPAGRCVMGSSFGAVAALAVARAAPGFFGCLLLQSGSFAGAGEGCRPRPERLWRPVRQFVLAFLAEPAAVAERVFVTCGAYESLICENRAFVSVLAATGMNVRFMENLDGHTWVCWRDGIGEALPWLFTTTV